MHRSPPRLSSALWAVLPLFLLLLLLTHADLAAEGVRQGLSLSVHTLIPALFPFLVVSELLIALQAHKITNGPLDRPLRHLLGISGNGVSALLLGVLCGFPTGTVTAASLYEQGSISREELRRLVLFVNNPGVGFLIGAVGKGMFGSAAVGGLLLSITLLTALTIGLLLRLFAGTVATKREEATASPSKISCAVLADSVKRALFTMLQIAALVLFFSCVTTCLSRITEAAGLPSWLEAAILGTLELTTGIGRAVATLSPTAAFRCSAFLIGFSGLSVCLQVLSVSEGKPISASAYLLSKLLQGGLCLLLSDLYLRLLEPHWQLLTTADIPTAANGSMSSSLLFVLLFLMLLLTAMAFLQGRKRKKRSFL